jgi:flavin-dependent dehydrogenase
VTDVIIAGAGPAGSVAATVLARAGLRVRLFDRASFPREKLCGDTVNPGTLAALRHLRLWHAAEAGGLRVDGMVVTGEGGVTIEGRYPRRLYGCAITRSELDWALVQEAVRAGAVFEPGVAVREALFDNRAGTTRVRGVRVASRESARGLEIEAPVTIAADGRASTLAFGLGLAAHPDRPRRWAMGAYFEGVAPSASGTGFGEMHIRRGHYIGVAPVADGRTNVCLVKPSHAADAGFRDPASTLRAALDAEPILADRFRRARLVREPVLLGPLAVHAESRAIDGLLVAGDASGFVDPMTGDGLRFAVRGGALAADAALEALAGGWTGVHAELRRWREQEFASKWRFNRFLRAVVASPAAVRAAAVGARFTPGLVRAVVARAGDCDRAD